MTEKEKMLAGKYYLGWDTELMQEREKTLECGRITIGDNVLIGPNVGIYTVNHAFNSKERAKGYERSLPVNIGDNVWIGGNVSILGGVTIGDDSIIAAGSVVTKDIPNGVIAAGNPAKVLREITDNDKIQNYI